MWYWIIIQQLIKQEVNIKWFILSDFNTMALFCSISSTKLVPDKVTAEPLRIAIQTQRCFVSSSSSFSFTADRRLISALPPPISEMDHWHSTYNLLINLPTHLQTSFPFLFSPPPAQSLLRASFGAACSAPPSTLSPLKRDLKGVSFMNELRF